ncbi:uncharacterized protein BDR25DRAFT_305825 [Lindgomyces ingoldianus]|uniref:Uncharacterized protein n=1 Tax=Lindgomyces ingoldianus TaxID=673940 RepID=A0ACB6QJ98_9PLEO|nr:uncharacterized protein BDR25DRAFT_305825 [Lindgomyces ingoldianus]KAF2467013.1 hypothetical protein BDR25DRAFT_305825 [Lindgomyces ingoldianus]
MSQSSPELPLESRGFRLQDLTSIPPKERQALVQRVSKIERKSFPSSEAFDFDTELKKKNINLILALKELNGNDDLQLVGYLVYIRMKRLALLHKICVVEHERRKGIGKSLIHSLVLRLKKGGCRSIHLWVDEGRDQARALYKSFEFQQMDRCADYYGPGRTGLRMQLIIEN